MKIRIWNAALINQELTNLLDKFTTKESSHELVDTHNASNRCIMQDRERSWKLNLFICQTAIDLLLMQVHKVFCLVLLELVLDDSVQANIGRLENTSTYEHEWMSHVKWAFRELTSSRHKTEYDRRELIENEQAEVLACMHRIAVKINNGHLIVIKGGICLNDMALIGLKNVLDPLAM